MPEEELVSATFNQTVEDSHRDLVRDENGPRIDFVKTKYIGGKTYDITKDRFKKLSGYGYCTEAA